MEMKRNLLFLLVLGAFLASVAVTSNLMSQGGNVAAPPATGTPQATSPAPRPPIPVAVVDYKYLMQIHPKLFADTNTVIQAQKDFKVKYESQVKDLQGLNRELEGITAGSADYTRKREELRRRTTDLEISAADYSEKNQTFLIQANYSAYQDIKKLVDITVKENNIIVVMDFLDIPRQMPVEQTLESMMFELTQSQSIVSCNPNYDITPIIEQKLNLQFAGKYPAVNFSEFKQQMFGGRSPAGPVSLPTSVANGNNQLRPQ